MKTVCADLPYFENLSFKLGRLIIKISFFVCWHSNCQSLMKSSVKHRNTYSLIIQEATIIRLRICLQLLIVDNRLSPCFVCGLKVMIFLDGLQGSYYVLPSLNRKRILYSSGWLPVWNIGKYVLLKSWVVYCLAELKPGDEDKHELDNSMQTKRSKNHCQQKSSIQEHMGFWFTEAHT